DASHELRTPIATLRANIQTLEQADRLSPEDREGLRADIIEELDSLTALVADVVELARGAGTPAMADDVALDQIVESALHSARRRRAPPARVGARARHRAPGGGGARGTRRGGQRPARGRTARGLVRPAHALTPAEPEKRALWTNVRPSGAPLERHDRPTDRTPLGVPPCADPPSS